MVWLASQPWAAGASTAPGSLAASETPGVSAVLGEGGKVVVAVVLCVRVCGKEGAVPVAGWQAEGSREPPHLNCTRVTRRPVKPACGLGGKGGRWVRRTASGKGPCTGGARGPWAVTAATASPATLPPPAPPLPRARARSWVMACRATIACLGGCAAA